MFKVSGAIDYQLDFILKGGRTRRYHTNATIRDQNVAEHSFFVAWLYVLMYGNDDLEPILASLYHDIAEGTVGDIPSPVKRESDVLKRLLDDAEERALAGACLSKPVLTTEQNRRLKMADNMEGLLHCADELRRGNKDAREIFDNFYRYITTSSLLTNDEVGVLAAIERRSYD